MDSNFWTLLWEEVKASNSYFWCGVLWRHRYIWLGKYHGYCSICHRKFGRYPQAKVVGTYSKDE